MVAVVVGFVALLPSTRALVQCSRVRAGLTEEEVVAMLGPSVSQFKFTVPMRDGEDFQPQFGPGITHVWLVGSMKIQVIFWGGRVKGKSIETDLEIARRLFPTFFKQHVY